MILLFAHHRRGIVLVSTMDHLSNFLLDKSYLLNHAPFDHGGRHHSMATMVPHSHLRHIHQHQSANMFLSYCCCCMRRLGQGQGWGTMAAVVDHLGYCWNHLGSLLQETSITKHRWFPSSLAVVPKITSYRVLRETYHSLQPSENRYTIEAHNCKEEWVLAVSLCRFLLTVLQNRNPPLQIWQLHSQLQGCPRHLLGALRSLVGDEQSRKKLRDVR
jgi:hypothetical protein